MIATENATITVEVSVNAPIEKAWLYFTDAKHIVNWYFATDEWHSPRAENDLQPGGKFTTRMEAKDGSFGFDFAGSYTKVEEHSTIEMRLDDGRMVNITFTQEGDTTHVVETFEPEPTHPIDIQSAGWQAILNNFKKYIEAPPKGEKLTFEATIDAPVEKVYATMLDEQHYQTWTAAFNPSSCFQGSWEKGSKILFIGTDEQGNKGGMVSRIKENIPNSFVSIEHLGILQGEQEIISGPEVESWAGALENYSFTEQDGKTLLSIEMDSNEEFKQYFQDTWPKALNILKTICEG
ncbi:SRPBCC family protein [Aridibaculum aurantiacum]|uniref:SRPBCC family protein n=1 Tax=Aridibaculum aurantiacum TaxID=2810307 RepID=UPI001A973389|nr:SRPBCC family protein [Aridibaculum aurantiacum]